jgi:hypothetical protein
MQTVLKFDLCCRRPRAYTHRHKLWEKPDGWGKEGLCEVHRIIEMLEPMILGEPNQKNVRQIFPEKPHITCNNYFSGDEVMDYLGEKGFSATMTCQRNGLPQGVDRCFLHKEKMVPGDKYARVARFNKPITRITKKTKEVLGQMQVIGEKNMVQPTDVTWTRVHVMFQLTSSTNISTVMKQRIGGRWSAKSMTR